MIIYSKKLLLPLTTYPKKIPTRLINILVRRLPVWLCHLSYQEILEKGDNLYVGDFLGISKFSWSLEPGFGPKSLNELKEILNYFAQDIPKYYIEDGPNNKHEFGRNWRPDNFQELLDAKSDFYLKDWVGYPITQKGEAHG